jgi:hypothetical protein
LRRIVPSLGETAIAGEVVVVGTVDFVGSGVSTTSTASGWKVISGRAGDLAVRMPPSRSMPLPRLVVSRKGRVNWSLLHRRLAFGKKRVRTESPEGTWRFEEWSFARHG